MDEVEELILKIAEKYKDDLNKFIGAMDDWLKYKNSNDKGDTFISIGKTLFQSSYFNLSIASWKHSKILY